MSVLLSLAFNNQDPRTVPKTIVEALTVTCELKDPTNLIDPVFIVDYNSTILYMNYCFTGELSPGRRYYFIRSIDMAPGHKLAVTCHEDVLATYANAILNSKAVIERCEDYSKMNKFLSDGEAKPYQYTRTWTHAFNYTFNPFNHIYLTTIG